MIKSGIQVCCKLARDVVAVNHRGARYASNRKVARAHLPRARDERGRSSLRVSEHAHGYRDDCEVRFTMLVYPSRADREWTS